MADLSNLKIKDTDLASDALYNKVNAIADALNVEYKTNCVTEIPQDIKLDLNNGTLTLKAGSKVYNGNGLLKTLSKDVSLVWNFTGTFLYAYCHTLDSIIVASGGNETVSSLPSPAQTYKLFFNTNDGKCYYDDNTIQMNECSFPIAICTANNGITNINRVFNGVGYIGSTVFVLPNVSGLIPNGRNADGSLKNKLVKTQNIVVLTEGDYTQHQYQFVLSNGTALTVSADYDYTYDKENNLIKRNNASVIDGFVISECDLNRGVVSNFNSNKVFQALDYNYLPYLWSSNQTQTSDYSPSVVIEEGEGYIKFSSGVIIQWGVTTSNPIVFPQPFINTNYSVTYLSYAQVLDRNYSIDNNKKTTTSVSIYQWCTGSSWQAIGRWK